jgi:hypothetical protein
MTTLEEISRCPIANRTFWTERARMNLTFARYQGAGPADVRLELAAFRKNMAHRRAQTYLERGEVQLDMFGEAA